VQVSVIPWVQVQAYSGLLFKKLKKSTCDSVLQFIPVTQNRSEELKSWSIYSCILLRNMHMDRKMDKVLINVISIAFMHMGFVVILE